MGSCAEQSCALICPRFFNEYLTEHFNRQTLTTEFIPGLVLIEQTILAVFPIRAY